MAHSWRAILGAFRVKQENLNALLAKEKISATEFKAKQKALEDEWLPQLRDALDDALKSMD